MHIVIIGGGHAAAQIITVLKQKKFNETEDGKVTLISDEPDLPYQRPPLSKAYLKGELGAQRLPILRSPSYEALGVDMQLGKRADAIDTRGMTVTLNTGERIKYDKLILATGGRARQLTCPGSELGNIFMIRTKEDIDSLSPRFHAVQNIAVIGGGYIGLEAASVAAVLSKNVTVFEAEERLLARVVAPEVSDFYKNLHKRHGVKVQTNAAITKITKSTNGLELTTKDGQTHLADLVIVGIGLIPNTELATSANLETDKFGITVNPHCQTSNNDIYSVGDVASFFHPHYKRQMRLESVQNAVDMAKVATLHILGEDIVYNSLPWFWSDQFGIKLQIAGLSGDADQVIRRGEKGCDSAAFFYLKQGRLIAADCAGRIQEFMASKKLIEAGVHPGPDQLIDDSRPFKEIAAELLSTVNA